MNTYSAFEGDLVRPLGFVTLYAAYAEQELGELIQLLCDKSELPEEWHRQPVGWKLGRISDELARVRPEVIRDLLIAVYDARVLFAQRNELIHGSIFSPERLVSQKPDAPDRRVSPDSISALADALFNCKERLNVYRQKQLVPALAAATSEGGS